MLKSYTSAGNLPWKLLRLGKLNRIQPLHIQLIPTNRCNANCSWCSCSKVDRTQELDYFEIRGILGYFKILGSHAITITGGGEPTIHHDFDRILIAANRMDYYIGLVTNGLRMRKGTLDWDLLNRTLTWLRVSVIDTEGDYDIQILETIISNIVIDIGISFTVTDNPNIETAKHICDLVNHNKHVTHIRFVSDILHSNNQDVVDAMTMFRDTLKCSKAIYQYRSTHTNGDKECRIAALKPIINADGYVYPCCGVQYATADTKRMPEKFRMCRWEKFVGQYFDGSICSKCYYHKYNDALRMLTTEMEHESFI